MLPGGVGRYENDRTGCKVDQIMNPLLRLTEESKEVSFSSAPIGWCYLPIHKFGHILPNAVVLLPSDRTSLKEQGYGLVDLGLPTVL